MFAMGRNHPETEISHNLPAQIDSSCQKGVYPYLME